MISKQHRFSGKSSINAVYKKGGASRSGQLSLKFIPKKTTDYRLAVVVSKKVSKSAVVRNRIRRRIFELVRKKIENPQTVNQDMVITVFSPEVAELKSQNLEKMLDELLTRADIKI